MATNFKQECFFIAPTGEAGTDIRKRSDGVRDWVVKPAAKEAADLETLRADDVGEPGQITAQAVQHCLKAKAAVADHTGGNPNVYYELSVGHGALLPVVLIAQEGTNLPFDISQSRVIFFDHADLSSSGRARIALQKQIEASLSGTPDNPISDGMRLAELQAGNTEEQTLAVVLGRLQSLSRTTDQINQRLRQAESSSFEPSPRHVLIETFGGTEAIPDDVTPVIREWTTADGVTHRRMTYEMDDDVLSPSEKAELIAEAESGDAR